MVVASGAYFVLSNDHSREKFRLYVFLSSFVCIVLEATKILAKRFRLSYQEIVFGLPKIDTSRTIINDICPTFLKPIKCEVSRYRSVTIATNAKRCSQRECDVGCRRSLNNATSYQRSLRRHRQIIVIL